jgi:hypothetical protein
LVTTQITINDKVGKADSYRPFLFHEKIMGIDLKFENLVLPRKLARDLRWARSEIIGSACNSFKE